MFIEVLWEESPELVERALKRICNVDEKKGDTFDCGGMKNGVLNYGVKHGDQFFEIAVSDFEISAALMNRYSKSNTFTKKWVKFMHKIMGDKYIYHYIAHRNEELDKFVDAHKKETAGILDELGFDATTGKTK